MLLPVWWSAFVTKSQSRSADGPPAYSPQHETEAGQGPLAVLISKLSLLRFSVPFLSVETTNGRDACFHQVMCSSKGCMKIYLVHIKGDPTTGPTRG